MNSVAFGAVEGSESRKGVLVFRTLSSSILRHIRIKGIRTNRRVKSAIDSSAKRRSKPSFPFEQSTKRGHGFCSFKEGNVPHFSHVRSIGMVEKKMVERPRAMQDSSICSKVCLGMVVPYARTKTLKSSRKCSVTKVANGHWLG